MEHLFAPPLIEGPRARPIQFNLGLRHLEDSLSARGTVLADFQILEIKAQVDRILFLERSAPLSARHQALSPVANTVGLEIGRRFVTQDGHYGRLGAQYLHFMPASTGWLGFSLDVGILEKPAIPWSLLIQGNYLRAAGSPDNFLLLATETTKYFILEPSSRLGLGGRCAWSRRSTPPPSVDAREYMQFTLGPLVDWEGPLGHLRAGIHFRIWLNEELNAEGRVTHPTEISAPDLFLEWFVLL